MGGADTSPTGALRWTVPAPPLIDAPERKPLRALSLGRFVVLSFFLTCGGPFGLEDAVGAGGILVCLLGLLLLPFVWAIPQSLMTAELATMMPENGGSYIWVWRALGETSAVVNAYASLTTSFLDICLYPSLVAAYMPSSIGFAGKYALKVVLLASLTCCNILGLDMIGMIEIILLVLCMSVFASELPFAVVEFSPTVWSLGPKSIDWGLVTSILLWSNTGWDSLGAIAGEVNDPTVTYPLGIALALLMSSCAYIIPIIISYSILPDPSLWHSDAFYDAALRISPLLAVWMRVACACGSIGQLNAGIASTSRRMWAMASDHDLTGFRTLPRFISTLSGRFVTPLNALFILFVVCSLLSVAEFAYLIQVEMLLNCCCLMFEFTAFLVLKYTEPDAHRPYVVPGGLKGAWAITILKTIVVVVTFLSMTIKSPVLSLIVMMLMSITALSIKTIRWTSASIDLDIVQPLL